MPARVARLIDVTVMGGDADAETVGVAIRKFRDIVGDLAFREPAKAGMK